MPSGVLNDVELFGLYHAICLAAYNPVLCFSSLSRSQEINRSRYGGDDPPFNDYDSKTGKVYNSRPLRASKRSKTGSGVIVDVQRHPVHWSQDIQFSSITRC